MLGPVTTGHGQVLLFVGRHVLRKVPRETLPPRGSWTDARSRASQEATHYAARSGPSWLQERGSQC